MQNTEISYKKNNTVEFRNEKKIIFNQSANYLINFLKFLKFKEIYEARQINSIYFETKNFTDLIDTINGEKNRSKLRLRWYGNTFNNISESILENKIKTNNHNYKIKYNLGKIEFKKEIKSSYIKNLMKNLKNLNSKVR